MKSIDVRIEADTEYNIKDVEYALIMVFKHNFKVTKLKQACQKDCLYYKNPDKYTCPNCSRRSEDHYTPKPVELFTVCRNKGIKA